MFALFATCLCLAHDYSNPELALNLRYFYQRIVLWFMPRFRSQRADSFYLRCNIGTLCHFAAYHSFGACLWNRMCLQALLFAIIFCPSSYIAIDYMRTVIPLLGLWFCSYECYFLRAAHDFARYITYGWTCLRTEVKLQESRAFCWLLEGLSCLFRPLAVAFNGRHGVCCCWAHLAVFDLFASANVLDIGIDMIPYSSRKRSRSQQPVFLFWTLLETFSLESLVTFMYQFASQRCL
jgi:hypothetical protein